uniref:Carbonic anhydrase-related protein 10 n=1 Tax=Aceria tosichella TaxID=561515 RepID=A0A6G1SQB8_9ACAR
MILQMIPASPFCPSLALAALILLTTGPTSFALANLYHQSASDELDDSSQHQVQQEGSWSHWWSYDGISGPDYWNINKHWRLCASGRKQSPVNIRTERLVYDHLLGPIRLRWQQKGGGRRQEDNTPSFVSSSSNQRTVSVRLINSGRGVEAWLEPPAGLGALIDSSSTARGSRVQPKSGASDHNGEQLILSHGPLSYEYKFFKIELHSASPSSVRFEPSQIMGDLETGLATDGGKAAGDTGSAQTGDNGWLGINPNGEDETSSSAEAAASGPSNMPNEILPEALRARSKSSEHLIDGRSFEAELQLHFYNRHLASTSQEALRLANEQPQASLFAVISVLISLTKMPSVQSNKQPEQATTTERLATHGASSSGGISGNHNKQTTTSAAAGPLDFILDNLDKLQNQGDHLELKLAREQLETLLTDKSQYVTYQGSMTRPPCAESVDWIILNRPLRVDEGKFLQLFERMNTNQENVRPIMQLNNRLLRTTINNLRYKRTTTTTTPVTGGSSSALGIGAGLAGPKLEKCHNKTNCNYLTAAITNKTLNSAHLAQTAANQLDAMTQARQQHQRPNGAGSQRYCSMKPRYAYQFSYGQFGY